MWMHGANIWIRIQYVKKHFSYFGWRDRGGGKGGSLGEGGRGEGEKLGGGGRGESLGEGEVGKFGGHFPCASQINSSTDTYHAVQSHDHVHVVAAQRSLVGTLDPHAYEGAL